MCKILVRKQEVLQMRIVPSDHERDYSDLFRFEPMETPEQLDISTVSVKTKDDWADIVSDDHAENKIDVVNGPLWRIILVNVKETVIDEEFPYQYVILLKFIHTIVDGLSVFDFVNRQFLPILSTLLNGEIAEDIVPYIPQTRPIEELFPEAQKPFSFFTNLQLNCLRWKNRVFKPNSLPDYKFPEECLPNKGSVKETLLVPTILEKDICDAVILAAKTHAVTVHCVLLSAGTIALSRTAKQAGVKLPSVIRQTWPVSLRKHLDFQSPEPLSFFGTDAATMHEADPTDITSDAFWMTCSRLKPQIENEKSLDKSIYYLKGVKYVHDEALKNNILTVLSELGQPGNLFLSNLGNMHSNSEFLGKNGSANIRAVEQYFCLTGLAVTEFCPLAQFLLTFDKRFMYTVCYNPRKVSRKFIETYIENLKGVLIAYCSDDLGHI